MELKSAYNKLPVTPTFIVGNFVIFITKYNIRKLNLLSKMDISKTAWINPCIWCFHVTCVISHQFSCKSLESVWRCCPASEIFFLKFILIWKCQKWSLNMGTLVPATAIYQTKCPFLVLSALSLFFWTLPYDSRLFPNTSCCFSKNYLKLIKIHSVNVKKLNNYQR